MVRWDNGVHPQQVEVGGMGHDTQVEQSPLDERKDLLSTICRCGVRKSLQPQESDGLVS